MIQGRQQKQRKMDETGPSKDTKEMYETGPSKGATEDRRDRAVISTHGRW